MLDCFCKDSLSNASYGFVIDKKENFKIDYTVCLKKNVTLLKWLPNWAYIILWKNFDMYGKLKDQPFIWYEKIEKKIMLRWTVFT